LPTPGSPRTTRTRLSPVRTASISRSSAPRSLSRSVSAVARPRAWDLRSWAGVTSRPGRQVGVSAHTASRLAQITAPKRPRPAATSTSRATRCGRRSRPRPGTCWGYGHEPRSRRLHRCLDRSVTSSGTDREPRQTPASGTFPAVCGSRHYYGVRDRGPGAAVGTATSDWHSLPASANNPPAPTATCIHLGRSVGRSVVLNARRREAAAAWAPTSQIRAGTSWRSSRGRTAAAARPAADP
jgi:hypothetical protein